MTCEEFEAVGLDVERDASLSGAERDAAAEHLSSCARCAALQDSWLTARFELRGLAEQTAEAQAPARVEMRLRQEFRTQYHTLKVRRVAVVSAWALAAAAVLVGTVSWINWRVTQNNGVQNHSNAPQTAGNLHPNGNAAVSNPDSGGHGAAEPFDTLVADNELGDFTLLPGVLPGDTDDAAILRVRMQRGALGALGFPVNEDLASEWIQVDLLVGNDGSPQAVRLPQ
jgi:anti-sigma factor RsiW